MGWGDDTPRLVANARNEVIDYLDELMTELVGDAYPTDATPEVPAIPYVQVSNDGAPSSTQISMIVTIRVTYWADNPTPAFDGANHARSLLLSHPGSPRIDSVRPGIGIVDATDDRTNHELASFTVLVAARNQ